MKARKKSNRDRPWRDPAALLDQLGRYSPTSRLYLRRLEGRGIDMSRIASAVELCFFNRAQVEMAKSVDMPGEWEAVLGLSRSEALHRASEIAKLVDFIDRANRSEHFSPTNALRRGGAVSHAIPAHERRQAVRQAAVFEILPNILRLWSGAFESLAKQGLKFVPTEIARAEFKRRLSEGYLELLAAVSTDGRPVKYADVSRLLSDARDLAAGSSFDRFRGATPSADALRKLHHRAVA